MEKNRAADFSAQTEIDQIRVKYHLPALAAHVVSDKFRKSYFSGFRKWGDPTLAEVTDKIHIGSCTKALTATVLAIFIERGALKWSSTLEDLFPELTKMHAAYKKVSIELLAAHRSGVTGDLVNFQNGRLWELMWNPRLDPVEGRRIAAHDLLTAPPTHAPESKYEYSTGNYVILGAILEKFSGKSWEQLIREELFQPLQMSSGGFGAQANAGAKLPDQPWPHRFADNSPVPVTLDFYADLQPTLGPSGTVHCAIDDWGKFAKLHMDGYNGLPTPILTNASFKKLHENYPGQEYTYGGWSRNTRSWADGPVLSHAGSNNMNAANIWIAPLKSLCLLSATNIGGGDSTKATVATAVTLLLQNRNQKSLAFLSDSF